MLMDYDGFQPLMVSLDRYPLGFGPQCKQYF